MVNRARKKTASKTTRKQVRGAVREKQNSKEKGLPIIRSVLFCAVVALVCVGATRVEWQASIAKVKALASRPISDVALVGEFTFIDKQHLLELVNNAAVDNFIYTDISEIKKRVENVPWVEHVSIRRVWPDGIVLTVSEQKPIARWGEIGFINKYGEIVRTDQLAELTSLPVLYGEEKSGEDITRKYLAVAELMAANGVKLKGLSQDKKGAWVLRFNNDIELVMGRDNIIQKLRNFLYVYELKLKHQESEIEKIDLRYEKGLAVKWKETQQDIANTDAHNMNKLLVKVN